MKLTCHGWEVGFHLDIIRSKDVLWVRMEAVFCPFWRERRLETVLTRSFLRIADLLNEPVVARILPH